MLMGCATTEKLTSKEEISKKPIVNLMTCALHASAGAASMALGTLH